MAAFVLVDARTTLSRLPRLLVGLILCGVGIALMVDSDLGLSPWDVLHQGISNRTGVAIGTVGIAVGFVVLLAWIPLREPYGLGTVLNVLVIGITIDVLLPQLPDHPSTATQWVFLICGAFLFGPAGALYIGCGLGAGRRDGLMTALAKRGWTIRVVRTLMGLAVLVLGWALGGSVGVGTLLFALTIGPNTHFFLERLSLEPVAKIHPGPVLDIE